MIWVSISKRQGIFLRVSDIKLVDAEFANSFLSDDRVIDFFREIGEKKELPSRFKYLSDGNGLAVFELFDGMAGIHIAIKPEFRGLKSKSFGRDCIKFALNNFSIKKVLARIQVDRPEVLLYARMSGMVEYSRNDTHIFLENRKCH